jgi:hypothetical protein
VKEPHYFNMAGEHRKTLDLDSYEALFEAATSAHLAAGEGSVWYLASADAIRNIEAYTGQAARYIVCLRNPVDMAHSLHSEMHVNGNEPEPDFQKAWALQADRASGKSPLLHAAAPSHLQYRQSCALGTQVRRLCDTVPPDRIKLLFLENIAEQRQETLRDVLRFLGVPDDIEGIDLLAKNSAKKPASQTVLRLVSVAGALKRRLGIRVGLGVINRLRRWNTVTAGREGMHTEFRAGLVAAFAAEVDLLEIITGQNLDHWRH